MRSTCQLRPRVTLLLLAFSLFAFQGCATRHLLRWSRGEASIYPQPHVDSAPYVHPAGAVLAMPVTVVWDVVTFPFQWLWDVYPYGSELVPDERTTDSGDPD